MIKVLELRGYKSLKAMYAFHALMLGLKMLPAYMHEEYETFFERLQAMPEDKQEAMIREAAVHVPLESDEVEALICFCADKNGIPYGPQNIANLGPKELHEIIVAVCKEISKIKIDLVSESEKKKSKT